VPRRNINAIKGKRTKTAKRKRKPGTDRNERLHRYPRVAGKRAA
jgi:hypothetical protein